jgi:hypothetical protein
MRASILIGILLLLTVDAPVAGAESNRPRCPARGAQYTFSDGTNIEAAGEQGDNICRFKNLKTQATFDRLLGSFSPTNKLVKANAEKFQSLASLEVGQKIAFDNSGADVRGADGVWFYEVSIERSEKVATAAGTFPAFVILYDEQSPQGTRGHWQRRFWYAPDVGYAVKFEYLMLHGVPSLNYPKNWELTAFKPGGATR